MATLYDTFKSKGIVENLPNEFLAGELKYIHWAGYKWRPIDNKKSNVIGYQTNLNNLNLKLYGSELQIENSLQKFFMGNNYENFSFTQVLTAFEKLNKLLPIDIYKTQVKRIDVGAVINHNTEQEYNRWLEYKGKIPIAMIKRNTVYGKEFRQTNNKFKVYDKTFETKQTTDVKLQEALMRLELQGNNRYFNNRTNPIGLYTVADLIDPMKFKLLTTDFLNFYNDIRKKPNFDFSQWSTKEIRLYSYMVNTDTANAMKKYHKGTHKKERFILNC